MNKTSLSLARFIPWWIVFVLVLLFSVWHFRLELVQALVNNITGFADVEDISLDVSQIETDHLRLKDIKAKTEFGLLRIDEANMSFEIGALFGQQKMGTAVLENVQFIVSPTKNNHTAKPTQNVVEPVFVALELLKSRWPFDSLEINSITIIDENRPQLEKERFHFRAVDNKKLLELTTDSGFQVTGTLKNGHPQIALKREGEENLLFSLEEIIVSNSGNMSLNAFVDWNHLRQAIETVTKQDLGFSADLTPSGFELAISERELHYDFQLDISSTDITSNRITLSGASVQIFGELQKSTGSDLNIMLSPQTMLTADAIQTSDLVAKKLKTELQSKVEVLENNQIKATLSPVKLSAEVIQHSGATFRGVESQVFGDIHRDSNFIAINLFTESEILLEYIEYADISIKPKAIQFKENADLTLSDVDGAVFNALKFTIEDSELKFDENSINTESITISDLQFDSHGLSLTPHLMNLQIQFDGHDVVIPKLELKADYKSEKITISGNGEIEDPFISFQIDGNWNAGNDSLELMLSTAQSVDLSQSVAAIQNYNLLNDIEILMNSGYGDISIRAAKKGTQSLVLSSKFDLQNVNMEVEGVLIEELSAIGDIRLLPDIVSRDSVDIHAEKISYGVDISNVDSKILISSLNTDSLVADVNQLQGEILGGSFNTQPFAVDVDTKSTEIVLNLSGLDIESIVDQQGIEGLAANGILAGSLPIRVENGEIRIENGQLWNQSDNGRIQYSVDQDILGGAESALSEIVIKALKDFQYHSLIATTNYDPDGNLFIDFELKGISPEIDETRPVHLNVNTEQNLLSLLKSLAFTRSENPKLDEALKDHFKNSNN